MWAGRGGGWTKKRLFVTYRPCVQSIRFLKLCILSKYTMHVPNCYVYAKIQPISGKLSVASPSGVKVRIHHAEWQNLALPCGKCCSAYAAKLIKFTLKRIFPQLYFILQKLWNEKHIRIIYRTKNYVSLQLMANIGAAILW